MGSLLTVSAFLWLGSILPTVNHKLLGELYLALSSKLGTTGTTLSVVMRVCLVLKKIPVNFVFSIY